MLADTRPPANGLEAILPQQFKESLSDAEGRLLSAAVAGDWAICGSNSSDSDETNDATKSQSWGSEREIRADLIRWLCTDPVAAKRVDARGVWAYGAKVTGQLNLASASVPFPLSLVRCRLTGDFLLQYLKIPMLGLTGCAIESMYAEGAQVSGLVSLNEGFTSHGPVSLVNARLGSDLDCSKSHFNWADSPALNATGAQVEGNLDLVDSSATGAVILYGARVGVTLDCSRASFKNPDGDALNAIGAQITGAAFLPGASATGGVNLFGIRIGGDLSCDGAKFESAGDALTLVNAQISGGILLSHGSVGGPMSLYGAHVGGSVDLADSHLKNGGGIALNAENAEIKGNLILKNTFSAEGEVLLRDAVVGGVVDCTSGTFHNPKGVALDFSGTEIKSDVGLVDGFSAIGDVVLARTHIGGDLYCDRGKFYNPTGYALNANHVQILGFVYMRDGFTAKGQVNLIDAGIEGDLNCTNGSFDSHDDALTVGDAVVKGNIFLDQNFSAIGRVHLYGAHITGNLECGHGRFKNPTGEALNASNADVKGNVFFNDGFSAEGQVTLYGAQIGGNLECDQGIFKNSKGNAIFAERLAVTGSVFLRNTFSAEGQVDLLGAHIAGDLDCYQGTFQNPGGTALYAQQTVISGGAYLNNKFSANGTVDLLGAHIAGDLDCGHGTFRKPGGEALSAERAEIGQSVFLSEGFTANGIVNLEAVRVGTDLSCEGGKFETLNLRSANVKQTLRLTNMEGVGELDLQGAFASFFEDDKPSWKKTGKLNLDGFVYQGISGGPKDAPSRLDWLSRSEFSPQSYRQVAKTLRDLGDDDGAKQVSIELERRSRAEGRMRLIRAPLRWLSHGEDSLSETVVGYGIYPGRAIWLLGGLAALGWVVFRRAKVAGAMAPTEKDSYTDFHTHGTAPAHYPPFNPLIYAIENCVPLVKLGQDERWQPDPSPSLQTQVPATTRWGKFKYYVLERPIPDKAISPGVLRWFRWVMIVLGWVLATFFVAGLSGMIRTS